MPVCGCTTDQCTMPATTSSIPASSHAAPGTRLRRMAVQRILLLGAGDLTEETGEALAAAGADVAHLADPDRQALSDALEAGADAVAVVSRDDAWPLRAVLLVRHLDADVPIVATISDAAVGRRLEAEIGGCTIVS